MAPKSTRGRKSSARASSGQRTRRLLTGTGAFADDRQTPRVLHVAFRRSEQSHARIKAIDCGAARKAAGVIAVFTADDLAATVEPLFATSRMKGYHATPILPLARGKVRYVGEPVVGIVAQSRYLAEDALELIDIEFEPLPVGHRSVEAVKDDAPLLARGGRDQRHCRREFKKGDVEADARGRACEGQGSLPHAPQKAAGDRAAGLSRPSTTPVDARSPLHSSTRSLASCAMRWLPRSIYPAADSASSPPDVGGGFGGKGSLYPEEILRLRWRRGSSAVR